MNESANGRELLGLISFLQRSRCYLQGCSCEKLTDNKVLKYFVTKQMLSRGEEGGLRILGNFRIFHINLKSGKPQLLGDAVSRAPKVTESNDTTFAIMSSIELQVGDLFHTYGEDQLFGQIWRTFNEEFPKDETQKRRIENPAKIFTKDKESLRYLGRLCIPSNSVGQTPEMAHD